MPAHLATIIGPLPTHCGSVGTASSTVLATWPGTAHHNLARNPGDGICELVMNFELTDTGLLGNTALRPGVEEELCEDDCGVHLTFAHSWEETNIPAWSEQGLQGAGPRGVGVCLGWGCEQVSSLQGDPAFPILPSTLARLVPSTPPSPRASRLPAAPSHTAPLQAPARPSTVLFFHLSSSVYSLTG